MNGARAALRRLSRRDADDPRAFEYYLRARDFERRGETETNERGYETRDPNMPYLGGPPFDLVRADPRFQALLRRMNLPQ